MLAIKIEPKEEHQGTQMNKAVKKSMFTQG